MTDEEHLALVIEVVLHDGRFHGEPEWPPAPARLFQALLAAVGAELADRHVQALTWLERLKPPIICAPAGERGQSVKLFVPNNDLDAEDGDPSRIAETRVAKKVRPLLVNGPPRLLYAWEFSLGGESQVAALCDMAARLYQLGRGVDGAGASARVVPVRHLDQDLQEEARRIYRPTPGDPRPEYELLCPAPGSLRSLQDRFTANQRRLEWVGAGRDRHQAFRQPPKPRFHRVGYAAPPRRVLFELRPITGDGSILGKEVTAAQVGGLAALPPTAVAEIVRQVQHGVVQKLQAALPGRATDIDEYVKGKWEGRPPRNSHALRSRFVPLPSIGHRHVVHSVRRILVEMPGGGAIYPADLEWALSGVSFGRDGEGENVVLARADDKRMLQHYGVGRGYRASRWRTETPAVLPAMARRRRIDPARTSEDAKDSGERREEEQRAEACVQHALRHAGVATPVLALRVQREPFDRRGERAERFALGTRFEKERLWHVEIEFARPLDGPLVIGDGRYLGLGLMAPVKERRDVFAFNAPGLSEAASPEVVCRAARRAVMSLAQRELGARRLPSFFSAHGDDGSPGRDEGSHLAFGFDPARQLLLIVAPRVPLVGTEEERRGRQLGRQRHLAVLERALREFTFLRAGAAGVADLQPAYLEPEDELLAPAKVWTSRTPYRVNRHRDVGDARQALLLDVVAECARRELPAPEVTVGDVWARPRIGLEGHVMLAFRVAVAGPLLLGQNRHFGGGLFGAVRSKY